MLEVVEQLGRVQRDPTSAVAPTEHLVMFSRLGSAYSPELLDQLLFQDRRLFEYWAYVLPIDHLPLHTPTMRRYPRGDSARARYVRKWLVQNAAFRKYVLGELRRRGPLRSRDLEDRAAVPWSTGGWNDGKSLGRMLDVLWFGGRIAVVGREGRERRYDLAERYLPASARLPDHAIARRLADLQLKASGLARAEDVGRAFDGMPPGRDRAWQALVRDGVAVPCEVDGLPGKWYAHADVLLKPFKPRTVLLSPFDRLVNDRGRTRLLFGFDMRLEIYVPKAERRHGYFVLPILHGDRLIGRVDPTLDRRASRLRVNAVYAEPDATAATGSAVAGALSELAAWLGVRAIELPARLPRPWVRALRRLA